jgi:hypothetical protein
MKYAVAILYEDFPRYDRVKQSLNKVEYFDGDTKVAEEPPNIAFVMREQILGIHFVEANNEAEAFDIVYRALPKHIIMAVAKRLN